jgi:hypothetical protein
MQNDFFLSFERIHIHRFRYINSGPFLIWMLPNYVIVLLLSLDPISAPYTDILPRIQLHYRIVDLYGIEQGIIDLSALWRCTLKCP